MQKSIEIPESVQQRLFSENFSEHQAVLSVLEALASAAVTVSKKVREAQFHSDADETVRENVSGDHTLRLDLEADILFTDVLSQSSAVRVVASEEREEVHETGNSTDSAKLAVALDPLDGSGNIGLNTPIGTIFCGFHCKENVTDPEDHFMQNGEGICFAGYVYYAVSTTFVVSCGNGTCRFVFDESRNCFVPAGHRNPLPEQGSHYTANEGYWNRFSDPTKQFLNDLKDKNSPLGKTYSLRNVGSLVADLDRILYRGGVYIYPADSQRSSGKLRLLFECLPLGFLIREAGGIATNGVTDILEITPTKTHQQSPFVIGSKKEVEHFRTLHREG